MDIPNMIVVKTVDKNGYISENKWICFEHFRSDWESKMEMPDIGDLLIRANVYGEELIHSTFGSVVNMLENKFHWRRTMEEVIVYEDCLNIDGSGDFVRCSDCGSLILMQLGGTSCGNCGSENLEWFDSNKPEWTVEELEQSGFIIVNK